MLLDFFRKLERRKWLPWIGIAAFIGILPIGMIIVGEVSRGLGVFAFLGSTVIGAVVGACVAHLLSDRVLKASKEIGQRLTAGFSGFGFALMPVLVGLWTNAYLDTGIDLQPLGMHILWAFGAGGICFCVRPPTSQKEEGT